MRLRRRTLASLPLAASLALTACSSDSITAPADLVGGFESPAADLDLVIRSAAANSELGRLRSPAAEQRLSELRRLIARSPSAGASGGGPQRVGPVRLDATPIDVITLLWVGTLEFYYANRFADATSPRGDRALAILHTIYYAYEGYLRNDPGRLVAGLEAAVEWYEQRQAEGLIPAAEAQWVYDQANVGISKSGGQGTTRTMCLSSDQRSCVVMSLASIRWDLAAFQFRLTHNVSYSFLDGNPAQIEVRLLVATGAPNCVINTDYTTTGLSLRSAYARREPALVRNPNNGGVTSFGCIPEGIIHGAQWDGFQVRDANGVIVASCGTIQGKPCFRPAAGAPTS